MRGGVKHREGLGEGNVCVCCVGGEGAGVIDGVFRACFSGDGGVAEGFKGCFTWSSFEGQGAKEVVL